MAHTHFVESGGGDDRQHDNSFVTKSELFTILKQISSVSQFYELEVFEVLDIYRIGGQITAPGVVRGRYLREKNKESFTEFKPLNSNILQYPVVGELWLGINYTIDQSTPQYIGRVSKDTNDVNDLPDYGDSAKGQERSIDTARLELQVLNSNRLRKDYRQGLTFTSPPNVPKLFASEGDTIIQGRFGNSIRLGSNQEEGEEFIQSPNIKLVSGLSIGQEDLDDDKSSIYLTSNEFVDYPNPTFSVMDDKYNNPQIVIDSDRLVFNAKKDTIGIYAQKDININSVEGDVFIHSNDKIKLKPKNSTIEFDIKDSGNGKIVNTTKEGVPFPNVNMAGLLKQITGIQKVFTGLMAGVPLLPSPIGIKKIVKGLEGAEDFIEATTNLEFLEKDVLTTKTPEEIKLALPMPANLKGIVGDIGEFAKDIPGGIAKAEQFLSDNKATLEQASQISTGIGTGSKKQLRKILENIPEDERNKIPGANDALAIALTKSVGGNDIPRAQENGVFRLLEDYIADQGSAEQDVEQLKMYGKILNLIK
jgi:hypothetical protein